MKTDIPRLRPGDTALTAARLMRRGKVGFLPVCDEGARVLGTLSDRDLTIRLLADELPSDTAVGALMASDFLTCRPSDEVEEAGRLMALRGSSWVLCVDSDRRLLGTIHLVDLAHLDAGSEPAQPRGRSITSVGAAAVDADGGRLGTVTRCGDGCFLIQTNGFSREGRVVMDDEVAWFSHGRVHLKRNG